MSAPIRVLAIAWVIATLASSITSFAGGDMSILGGWALLVLTAPFGLIWWFYLYEHVSTWAPANITQYVGVVIVDVLAFIFWFVAIPGLRTFTKSKSRNDRGQG